MFMERPMRQLAGVRAIPWSMAAAAVAATLPFQADDAKRLRHGEDRTIIVAAGLLSCVVALNKQCVLLYKAGITSLGHVISTSAFVWEHH